MEAFPNLKESRVINNNELLKQDPVLREKDKFGFKHIRFENWKNGQMDMLSRRNVKLVANKKCQDWVYKFKSKLRNGDNGSHKNMQSKRRDPNKIF